MDDRKQRIAQKQRQPARNGLHRGWYLLLFLFFVCLWITMIKSTTDWLVGMESMKEDAIDCCDHEHCPV